MSLDGVYLNTEAVCPPIFRRLSDSVVVMNQGHQPPLPTVEITLIILPF